MFRAARRVTTAVLVAASLGLTGCTLGSVHQQPMPKPGDRNGNATGSANWGNQAADISHIAEAAGISGVKKAVTLVLGNVAVIGYTDQNQLPKATTPTMPSNGAGLGDPNTANNQGGVGYSQPAGNQPGSGAATNATGYGTPTAPGGQIRSTAPGTGTGTEVTGPGTTAAPSVGHTGIQFAFPDMSDKDRALLTAIHKTHPEIVRVYSTNYPAYVQTLNDIAAYQASGHPITDRWQELQVLLQQISTSYHNAAPR